MKCPSCGALAPDDAVVCPRCHESLDATRKISLSGATWCPGCGALVAPGSVVCPKCGSSLVEESRPRTVREVDLPDIGNTGTMEALEAGERAALTQIESAIPPEDDDESRAAAHDRAPRPRSFALAALFALAIVGGAALLITHPWDPLATQTKAKEPADTSMSGYPGALDSLSGQDTGPGTNIQNSDTFETIESAYQTLVSLSQDVDDSEQDLRTTGISGGAEEREKGLATMRELSIKVSNHISSLGQLNDGAGAYAEDISNMETLGSWLRNRCDLLTEAWETSAAADDPASVSSQVISTANASNDYARLFSDNVEAWKPSRAS